MENKSNRKAGKWAKASLILGIMSLGTALYALFIIIKLRLPGRPTDDASLYALGFLAVFLLLVGLIVGIAGLITVLIARIRNEKEGNDEKAARSATIGLVLNALGIGIIVILLAYAVIFAPKIPPVDISTPIPSTSIP